jgi:hypothetical protein
MATEGHMRASLVVWGAVVALVVACSSAPPPAEDLGSGGDIDTSGDHDAAVPHDGGHAKLDAGHHDGASVPIPMDAGATLPPDAAPEAAPSPGMDASMDAAALPPMCCSPGCDPTVQYCDPASCTCVAQGSFDLSQATVYDSPPDIASWPATTTLTRLDIESTGFHVEFDKQDGASRWPDVYIPGWDGGNLQYSLWSVEYVNGTWAASGPIEFWYGLYESGGAPSGFAADWYYDTRWGPLASYQPAVGEWVGFFVAAGNTRNIDDDDPTQSSVMERSNVVMVPFPSDVGQNVLF